MRRVLHAWRLPRIGTVLIASGALAPLLASLPTPAPLAAQESPAEAPSAAPPQDSAVRAPSTTDDAPERAAPERAAFEETSQQWGELLRQMHALEVRFVNGDGSEDRRLRSEFVRLQVEGRPIFDTLLREAITLMQPQVDPDDPREAEERLEPWIDVIQFLSGAVLYRYERDWYELTGEAAELLLQLDVPIPKLTGIAGVSLYATNQFDRAEPLLRRASENEELDDKFFGIVDHLEATRALWESEVAVRAAEAERDDLPRVRLETTRGDMLIELFEDQAPNTVANFIELVESGFYDDCSFYQVISGRIALTGDPVGDGSGNAGYHLPDEQHRDDARPLFRGTLAMAKLSDGRTGRVVPDSASSQFFIALTPWPQAHEDHTAFGRVLEGLEVLSAIHRIDPTDEDGKAQRSRPEDLILQAHLVRKRDHAYTVEKQPLTPPAAPSGPR